MGSVAYPAPGRVVEAGRLPPWEVAKLPAPPPYSLKSALRVTGAAAIILGISIGSNLQRFGFEKTAKVETLQETIDEMGESPGSGEDSPPTASGL